MMVTKPDPALISLLSNLLYTVDVADFSLSTVTSYMLWFSVLYPSPFHGRTKRGLFDIIGSVVPPSSNMSMNKMKPE